MNLTFLNRCYWPDSEATGQLLTELCEYLSPKHRVSVIVGQPNFITANVTYTKQGTQNRNGVDIHRLVHSQLPKGKRFGRMRNLISFTLAVRKYLRGFPIQSNEVWVCETDPFLLPLVVGPAARRANRKGLNVRVVYYLQDIYPDVAVALGVTKNHLGIRMLRDRLKQEYASASRIIVLDDDMRDRLIRWGLPEDKFRVVPNWMDCETVRPIKTSNPFRLQHQLEDRFVVMHSGNMGMTQRLDVLVQSMNHPNTPKNASLLLVGNGAKRDDLVRQSSSLSNVKIFDYQPRERLAESLSAADLHVVTMDQAITGCLAPSKLYGILASGTAVLAIVPKGNAVWRLIEKERLGWCVEPGDEAGIASAIQQAASLPKNQIGEMGQRGRHLAVSQYDKQICCHQFEKALEVNEP